MTGILILLLLPIVFFLSINKPKSFIYMFMALLFFQSFLVGNLSGSLSGYNINVFDLFSICSLSMCLLHLIKQRRMKKIEATILIFVILCISSMVSGFTAYSPNEVFSDFRTFFHFWPILLYFIINKDRILSNDEHKLSNFILISIIVVVLFRLASLMLQIPFLDGTGWREGITSASGLNLRVIDATQSLVLVLLMISTLFDFNRWRILNYLLISIGFFLVIILEHRTIWLITVISIIYLLISAKKNTLVLIMTGSIMMILYFVLARYSDSLSFIQVSAEKTDTLDWRTEGWVMLLQNFQERGDIFNYFTGMPFGSGYNRYILGQDISVNPHNYYISIFLRTGAAGVATVIVFLFMSFVRANSLTKLMILVLMIYSFSYPITLQLALGIIPFMFIGIKSKGVG